MSRDDFLFVGKKNQYYLIVHRSASLDYPDRIERHEHVIATATEPSSAVLLANRLQREDPTEYGVRLGERVAKELGW